MSSSQVHLIMEIKHPCLLRIISNLETEKCREYEKALRREQTTFSCNRRGD